MTDIQAAYSITTVDSNVRIFAYKYLRLLQVSGWVCPTQDIPSGTKIAQISATLKQQTYCSPNSTNTTGGKLVLRINGQIDCELPLTKGHWYSYTFTVFTA